MSSIAGWLLVGALALALLMTYTAYIMVAKERDALLKARDEAVTARKRRT